MRAALFGPVGEDNQHLGALAETAAFSQWIHTQQLANLHYARWQKGEVDVVRLDPVTGAPVWAYDVKWSDHHVTATGDLKGWAEFAAKSGVPHLGASTKTKASRVVVEGHRVTLFPLALHCYRLGWLNVTEAKLGERLGWAEPD